MTSHTPGMVLAPRICRVPTPRTPAQVHAWPHYPCTRFALVSTYVAEGYEDPLPGARSVSAGPKMRAFMLGAAVRR